MFLDALQLYSDAQALTATAVSTNVIDHRQDRNLGIGEPLMVVVTVDVALAGTSPTFAVTLQTDDNEAFSSPTTVATSATQTSAAAGSKLVLFVPADLVIERYTRLSYTLGGTTPSITVTAFLTLASMVQNNVVYADAITITG